MVMERNDLIGLLLVFGGVIFLIIPIFLVHTKTKLWLVILIQLYGTLNIICGFAMEH